MRKLIVIGLIPLFLIAAKFDPTKPYIPTEDLDNDSIKVELVVSNTANPICVIKGKQYKIGDEFMGATITEITRKYIMITDKSGKNKKVEIK